MVDLAKDEFDTKLLCKLLGLARSSFYYDSTAQDDSWLRQQIEGICLIHHRRGYRRVTNALHREGIIVNKKRVQRLIAEMNLQVRPRRKRVITTKSQSGKSPYPNLLRGCLKRFDKRVVLG
ncbi:transposase [Candidatus Poribacteria bacterium]|nr:transposase [Candidatus Poribacteria bacterium]